MSMKKVNEWAIGWECFVVVVDFIHLWLRYICMHYIEAVYEQANDCLVRLEKYSQEFSATKFNWPISRERKRFYLYHIDITLAVVFSESIYE